MSLLTAIGHSLTGLRALQLDMQVVSSNVANAGREDYTRKHIILSANTTGGDGTGGVSVRGYGRSESTGLEKLLLLATSDSGLRGSQSQYLNRIQDLLGSSQDNPLLTQRMSEFESAWRSLEAAPEDSTRKQDVIFKAQNLSREINRIADGLDKIKQDVKDDLGASVDELNGALSRIASLNNEIVSAGSNGQSITDLQDLRDAEIKKVSELVKINVYEREQGRLSIYTPGGAVLLDTVPTEFSYNGTNLTIPSSGANAAGLLTGGKIESAVGMLDQGTSTATLNDPGKASIYKIEQQLEGIVSLFTSGSGTFATAYDGATTASGELASSFFTGTTRYAFAVNSDLLDGTSTVKAGAASVVTADMNLASRTFTQAGISLTSSSYTDITNGIIYKHNQNSQYVGNLSTVNSTQKDNFTKKHQDEVGVNLDEEIVRLTQLQNNYSAISRVIATAQAMLEMLDRIGGG